MAYSGYGQVAYQNGFHAMNGQTMMAPQNYNYPTNGMPQHNGRPQYASAPVQNGWQQTYQVPQPSPQANHHSPTQAQYSNGYQQQSPTQNGNGHQQASPPTYQHAAPHNPQNDPDRRPGDWDCPACGALCFASKTACFKCGEPRPASAGRPPSMFKASQIPRRPGDWDCPGCNFMCFASKTECPVCGTKKPIPPLPTHTLPAPTAHYQPQPPINQYTGFIQKPTNATPATVMKIAPAANGYPVPTVHAYAQNGMIMAPSHPDANPVAAQRPMMAPPVAYSPPKWG